MEKRRSENAAFPSSRKSFELHDTEFFRVKDEIRRRVRFGSENVYSKCHRDVAPWEEHDDEQMCCAKPRIVRVVSIFFSNSVVTNDAIADNWNTVS